MAFLGFVVALMLMGGVDIGAISFRLGGGVLVFGRFVVEGSVCGAWMQAHLWRVTAPSH